MNFVEYIQRTSLKLDVATEAGVFDALKASEGNKAVIGKEKADDWLENILKKKNDGR